MISRGAFVAYGDILEGAIKKEDFIDVEINEILVKCKIDGVEMIDYVSTCEFSIGLILTTESNINLTKIKLLPHIARVYN